MHIPSVTELRKLKSLGTPAARRALKQAWEIRLAAFKTAYCTIPVTDARGNHIDNYPASREFFDFLVRSGKQKDPARTRETIEQQLARQSEEIHGTLAAVEIKRNLWS